VRVTKKWKWGEEKEGEKKDAGRRRDVARKGKKTLKEKRKD
jgi:hypothetical protein